MCVSPITIRNKGKYGPRSYKVPCGKCVECLKQYQNDWFVRIYEECKNSSSVLFFTLTYSNEHVPYVVDTDTGELWLSVCVEHLQKAFKRFRVRRDLPNWKYFICSEYGPKTSRPHYHGLIFGLTKEQFMPFLLDWQNKFGFVNCKVVNFAVGDYVKVSRYVSKYCSKGVFENPNVSAGLVRKTFRLCSQHFGESYVDRMRDFHRGKLGYCGSRRGDYYGFDRDYISFVAHQRNVKIDGITYKMPDYYKDKIYGRQTCLSVALSNFLFEESCELHDRKLSEIQAAYNVSSHEAFGIMAMQEASDYSERADRAFSSLSSFYKRSTF